MCSFGSPKNRIKCINLEIYSSFPRQGLPLTNRANIGNNFVTDVRQSNFATPSNFITPSGVTVPHSLSAEFGVRFSF
jgi:hypothetical protein